MAFSYKAVTAVAASALMILTSAAPSVAQTPPDLRDLVGARAGQAEGEVRSRGYQYVRAQQGGQSSWTYWTRGDDCIQIETRDGRYSTIERMDRSNCRGGGSSDSGNAAGAILAGAAIVGLAAAIASHNRHHGHDDDAHNDEYSRGYRDGLYGASYDRNDTEAYHSGYVAGETERGNQRASNSRYVRGVPAAAQAACSRRADDYQNARYGGSSVIDWSDQGRGRYRLVMATGSYRSVCTVTGDGDVIDINPY